MPKYNKEKLYIEASLIVANKPKENEQKENEQMSKLFHVIVQYGFSPAFLLKGSTGGISAAVAEVQGMEQFANTLKNININTKGLQSMDILWPSPRNEVGVATILAQNSGLSESYEDKDTLLFSRAGKIHTLQYTSLADESARNELLSIVRDIYIASKQQARSDVDPHPDVLSLKHALLGSIEDYLFWRDNKSINDTKHAQPGFFTKLRHWTHFGYNRALDIRAKIAAAREDNFDELTEILQTHFKNASKVNNHSLDTYLIEALSKSTQFGRLVVEPEGDSSKPKWGEAERKLFREKFLAVDTSMDKEMKNLNL